LLAKALGTGALGPELHPLQISHGQFLFALIAISSVALVLRPTITRPGLKLHIARSALGWGGVTLMFAAATFIPLSDATAISFLNPVFGMITLHGLMESTIARSAIHREPVIQQKWSDDRLEPSLTDAAGLMKGRYGESGQKGDKTSRVVARWFGHCDSACPIRCVTGLFCVLASELNPSHSLMRSM